MKYSIIQVNTNNYDKIFECNDLDASERLLFTDANCDTENWTKIKISTTDRDYPFDDVFKIRWNPFDFTDTDYAVWLDGSIKIDGSVKRYVEEVMSSGADFATLKHPFRDDIYSEYLEWCRMRSYDKTKALRWMSRMYENGWNPKNKGLYQVCVCIFKNTDRVKEFGRAVIEELHSFNGDHLERLDQTVVTYLLKTKFKNLRVFELSEEMYKNSKELKMIWNHPSR